MIEYLILFLIFFFEVLFFSKINLTKRRSKSCAWFFFIQFYILFAFRSPNILCDTPEYYNHYSNLKYATSVIDYSDKDRFEIGYQILERFVHDVISSEFIVFNSITTAVILGSLLFFIYKYSTCTWLSILLLFLTRLIFDDIIAVRQGLATAIGLFGYKYLVNLKFIKYTIIILIASLFHSSALVLLIFIPIAYPYFGKRFKIIMITITSVLLFYIFPSLMLRYIANSGTYGVVYAQSSVELGAFGLIGIYNFINALIIFLYILYVRKYQVHKYLDNDVLFIISVIFLGVSFLSIRMWVLIRVIMYLLPFICIYVSDLYISSNQIYHKKKVKRATSFLLFLMIVSYTFFIYTRPQWISLFPYEFYFDI